MLWNKVMKEVKAKRYVGPYDEIPYETFIQSPIGLVPKDGGKDVRLIFHLSHPKKGATLVNANTPKEKCKVQYPNFNKAIKLCIKAGRACKLSKSDIKSAFRNLGLNKASWRYLIIKAESPFDGKTYYFVDKCLPFGASISCSHFQAFSDAISHIVRIKSGGRENVNYLDDFLFIALLMKLCNQQMEVFLEICRVINFLIALEKTYWGSMQMVFLGFLIDTVKQIVMVPVEKIEKAKRLIDLALLKRKIMLKDIQQICGFLNFLGRCIVPGRAFTRHLYPRASQNLKPHHHLRITVEMRADLSM